MADQLANPSGSEPVSLYLTAPDREVALGVARTLLAEQLIACANVFPAGTSLYRWEGEVREEPEVVLIAKSRADLVDRVSARVADLHPYDVPCVVALDVRGGHAPYLEWVRAEATG